MRRIFEFRCTSCGCVTERYIESHIQNTECDECGDRASKIISAPRIELDGTDPVYVSAYGKWAKKREEANKVARERNQG